VRFRSLEAHVFGVLRGRRLELPPEAALIFGSNESGKSTFRSALETILYGFDPADRDAHPFVVWDGGAGGDLRLEAEIERDAGPPLRVERALLSRGSLRVAEANAEFEGRRQGNSPLDCVRELPRELFRSVYSLELAQLAALDKGTQARVDDLLLPQAAVRGLRPIGEVQAELRAAHQALWRPNRLGKPEAARLSDTLEGLRREAGEMAKEEQGLRDARVEQASLKERLAELDSERVRLDRANEDAPLLRDLSDQARRRRALGPPIDLVALGAFPLGDPSDLTRECDELTDQAREFEVQLARAEEGLDASERSLLAAASDVALARSACAEVRTEAKQAAGRRAASISLREEARQQLAKVLARAPGAAELEVARGVPLEALRAAQARWAAESVRHAASRPPQLPPWALISVVLAGVLAVLALLLEPWLGSLARTLAVGAVTAGALAACAAWLARARRAPPLPPSLLTDLFAGLPPSPALLALPSELTRFVECIASTQASLARATGEELAAEGVEAGIRVREAQIGELCRRLGLAADGDAEQRSARLTKALEQAQARVRLVEQDRSERSAAQKQLDLLRPRLERVAQHRAAVESVLQAAEPAAPTSALRYARVKQRLEEAEFLRRREAELRSHPRFAALERDARVSAEHNPSGAEWSPETTTARANARAVNVENLAAANTRLGELANLLGKDRGSRQARVADRMSEVQERIGSLHHERDRLALLESILARAERRFRDEHQPPVLQRASAYLERVTHGRWRRINFEEGAEGGLFVAGCGSDESVRAAPPLSRGTLDQIFLCLRLGLLDHLDEGRERLPLVLDDALLRMDDVRRSAVYELLAEISRRRQVFLLTCQEWIAAEAERALELRRITLDD